MVGAIAAATLLRATFGTTGLLGATLLDIGISSAGAMIMEVWKPTD